MNKHHCSNRSQSSHSFMRNSKNSFVYFRQIRRNSWAMLEKSTSDWIRRGKPTRKNMYYHYSAFLNFPPTFACSLIAVFSFLIRFFELVRGNFHGQGCLSIPKRITARRMLGGWSTEWLSSQFFTSVSMLSPTGEGGGDPGHMWGIWLFKRILGQTSHRVARKLVISDQMSPN